MSAISKEVLLQKISSPARDGHQLLSRCIYQCDNIGDLISLLTNIQLDITEAVSSLKALKKETELL